MIKFLILLAIVSLAAGCSSQYQTTKDYSSADPEEKPVDDKTRALEHFIKGSIHESKGEYSSAILEYQDALKLDPAAGIHYALAKNYHLINKIPIAIQHARKSIEYSPQITEYYSLLGDIFFTARQYDSSAAILEKLLVIDSTEVNTYYKLARIYEMNKPLKAIEIYNKLSDLIGPEWSVLIRLAELHESLGNLDQAADALEDLIILDPSNRGIQKLLSEIYARNNDVENALLILNEIIEFSPEDLDARERKAQILLEQDDWKSAAEQYNYILEQPGISLEPKIRVGASYFVHSLKDSTALVPAKEFFKKMNRDTTHWQVKLYLAAIELNDGNDSLAERNFESAAELAPWNPQPWIELGGLYFDNQYYDEASVVMNQAVKLYPKDFVINLILGLALAQTSKYEDAKEYLRTANEINPNDLTVLSAYGYTLSQLKETDEAIRYMKRALEINPNDKNILGTLGLVYNSLEMWDECDEIYERALKIDSLNATINNNYAYSLSERGIRLDEALRMVEIALEEEPFNSSFLDTIGWIYYKLGNYEKAKENIEKALEIGGDRSVIIDHLGDVLFKLGDKNLAREYWQKAFDLDNTNIEIKNKIEKGEI